MAAPTPSDGAARTSAALGRAGAPWSRAITTPRVVATTARGRCCGQRRAKRPTIVGSESIADTIVREVREKSGIEARVEDLLGVYSNPRHVVVYDDGEVRQQFSGLLPLPRRRWRASHLEGILGGALGELDETEALAIHPSIRRRIQHYTEKRSEPVIG